jgi:RNA polymerase primary sigma factor
LIKAVERFDHHRGVRFATYAGWWIKQSVLRAAANQGRTIRKPPWLVQEMGQLRKARAALEARLQHAPTDVELAESLGWTAHRVREIAGYDRTVLSLDMPVSQDPECELADMVADTEGPTLSEEVLQRQMCEELLAAMRVRLDAREQTILRLRFGLSGEARMTLSQVAAELGVTPERVRQIEKRAMRCLRRAIAADESRMN